MVAGLVAAAPAAGASGTRTCSGTPNAPGVLVGTISGDVIVSGVCAVPAGPAVVHGNVRVNPGSGLLAAFGMNHSRLTVTGSVMVGADAVLVAGCNTTSSTCIDEPNPSSPTLSSHAEIGGSIVSTGALGVLAHNVSVGGSVSSNGGGGGVNCVPHGLFNLFQSPAFSAYEDMTVAGSVTISNTRSCWMGVNRVQIAGSLTFTNNNLADPDAIEILSNNVAGNLTCTGNSRVWDSVDAGPTFWPRVSLPNTVGGHRSGQCVLASRTTDGGSNGPGPF